MSALFAAISVAVGEYSGGAREGRRPIFTLKTR